MQVKLRLEVEDNELGDKKVIALLDSWLNGNGNVLIVTDRGRQVRAKLTYVKENLMLRTDVLYVIHNLDGSVTYGRTPDGEGMYFYDEDQCYDAVHDIEVPRVSQIVHFNTPREFDDFRYGPV